MLCKRTNKKQQRRQVQTKRDKSNQTARLSSTINNFCDTFGTLPTQQVMKRNAVGQFESTSYHFCPAKLPTSHQCAYLQPGGMKDELSEICVLPFCGKCGSSWGCEGSPYRCKYHEKKKD